MAGETVVSTGQHADLLTPAVSKVHFNTYNKVPMMLDKVAKMTTSRRNFETETEISGLPGHLPLSEGASTQMEYPISGNSKTQRWTVYSLGMQVTEVMLEDDLTGIIRGMSAELGRSAAYTRELQFWDIFNSGFTSAYTTADGDFLFDTDHSFLKAGADVGNEPSSAGALSQTTLEAGFDHFDSEITNHAGIPVQMTPPYKLIIPHAERWKAKELKLNPWKTGSANRTMNTMESEEWDYLAVRYLTSATAWFLLSQEHDIRFTWRAKLKLQRGSHFSSGNTLYRSRMRFGVWAVHWQGSYGNPGA